MDLEIRHGLAEAKAAWERENLLPSLEQVPERKAEFRSPSRIPIHRIYTPLDVSDKDYEEQVGFPGDFPYTRGAYPAMYRQSLWITGQYAGYGSGEDANQRYRHLLEQGGTGFSVALDLPSQMLLDPDDLLAAGEVGKVGVSLSSLQDMERLFDGIPLRQVRQIRTPGAANGPLFAAMVIAMARRQEVDPREIKLFVGNESLKEHFARGTYVFPPGPSLRHSVDLIEYCIREGLDTWTPLCLNGYTIRDAGADAVQELAFAFSCGVAYFDEAVRRGLDINRFARNVWIHSAADIYVLEEVAKFRAARRFWARLLRERYGVTDPEALALKIFAFTLGSRLTAQQPLNNLARVAIMTVGAALGGANTMHTSSFDEAHSIPTQEAATLALRIQQIVANESGLGDVVDPAGGSWAVETLTTEVERRVADIMQKIEARGGAVACVESGWYHRQLSDTEQRRQRSIESGEQVVVGVTKYASDPTPPAKVFRADPAVERKVVERLHDLKARRDPQRVGEALGRVEATARKGGNTVYPLVDALEADCTVGEISEVLRSVWGTQRQVAVF